MNSSAAIGGACGRRAGLVDGREIDILTFPDWRETHAIRAQARNWSREPDLNRRPPRYERGELPAALPRKSYGE
jgi:hypothetical protein